MSHFTVTYRDTGKDLLWGNMELGSSLALIGLNTPGGLVTYVEVVCDGSVTTKYTASVEFTVLVD